MGYTYGMSKAKRIFGRPPSGQERGEKSPQKSVRIPRPELQEIEKAAEVLGVPSATFIREAAVAKARRVLRNGK